MIILSKPISGNFERVLCVDNKRFYFNTIKELEDWWKEVLDHEQYIKIRANGILIRRITLRGLYIEVKRSSVIWAGVPVKGFYVLVWFMGYCLFHRTERSIEEVKQDVKEGLRRILTRPLRWIRLKKITN